MKVGFNIRNQCRQMRPVHASQGNRVVSSAREAISIRRRRKENEYVLHVAPPYTSTGRRSFARVIDCPQAGQLSNDLTCNATCVAATSTPETLPLSTIILPPRERRRRHRRTAVTVLRVLSIALHTCPRSRQVSLAAVGSTAAWPDARTTLLQHREFALALSLTHSLSRDRLAICDSVGRSNGARNHHCGIVLRVIAASEEVA